MVSKLQNSISTIFKVDITVHKVNEYTASVLEIIKPAYPQLWHRDLSDGQ